MRMDVTYQINSFFNSITYRLGNCLVDPGDVRDGFSNNVSSVLLTHAHFDHIYGLNQLLTLSPEAKVYTNAEGMVMLLDARKNMSLYHETSFIFDYPANIVKIEDGQEILLENGLVAKAIFTPGHNPSCITWIVEDKLFTGDAYIPGIKTVTNLPGGNKMDAEKSIDKIGQLSKGRVILPGHKHR